ncbi:MAG: tetratricopeptide repeat protein [Desulfobacteraceae bacterium]|nr:tetratricopeptide repeat protein [Desulfobacteraceae bacterium]MBC2758211.1 tetratricopeptide repeat protein [Desulfobacteraceae bacterium]
MIKIIKKMNVIYFGLCILFLTCFCAKSLIADEDDHFIKGTIEENKGRYENAIIEYKKSLEIYPQSLPEYYSIGNIYRHKYENYSEAIKVYKKGLKYFPNDFRLNLNIMYSYFSLNDLENGIKYYIRLSEIIDNNKSYSFPRDILQQMTKDLSDNEIMDLCHKYLEINPTDKILRELLVEHYMRICDYQNAKKEYELMLDYGYETGFVFLGLGICYYNLGEYDKSLKYLMKATESGEYVPKKYYDLVQEMMEKAN